MNVCIVFVRKVRIKVRLKQIYGKKVNLVQYVSYLFCIIDFFLILKSHFN